MFNLNIFDWFICPKARIMMDEINKNNKEENILKEENKEDFLEDKNNK